MIAIATMLPAIPGTVRELVPEKPRVKHRDVDQLREREYDDEGLEGAQAPSPVPTDADLLARQPERERRDGPRDERGTRGGGEAVAAPRADVVDAGELGGCADDAGEDGEDEEVEGGAVADGARVVEAVDVVVEVPAREADHDDVHDEVEDQQGGHHVPADSCHSCC